MAGKVWSVSARMDMVPARAFYEGAIGLELIDRDNGCRLIRWRVAANVKHVQR